MPLRHQAVQAVHAGIAAGRDLVKVDCPHLVLLTQTALVKLSCHLSKHGVAHRVFHEDDMGGRPTALATEPIDSEDRKRRLFWGLKTYSAGDSSAKVA